MTDMENWPSFDDDEIDAVVRVLRSGRVNRWTGEENQHFEEAFAEFVGADHAIALANGTVALELPLRCSRIGPGDEVIVTSRSFVASAGVVPFVGARPVFVDVDEVSQNITAETIRGGLTDRTRAVIVVHLGGWICDMDAIMEVANEHDLFVLEDCAQALGALRDGRPAGSWGHAATWSFCQDKVMTTGGEGGMFTTDDDELYARAWSFKDHGKNLEASRHAGPGPSFRWIHDRFGTNWRMTEMQAAIGTVALPKVPGRVDRRIELARRLDGTLGSLSAIRITPPPQEVRHAYYKYYAFIRPEELTHGRSRDDILAELHRRDVPAFTGICPEIYVEEAFQRMGYAPDTRLPVARRLGETALMLPIHHRLSDETVSRWGETVRDVISAATRGASK